MTANKQVFVRKYGNETASSVIAAGGDHTLTPRELAAYKLLPSGAVLVDVGCGLGKLTSIASARFAEVIGLDLMKERLTIARLLDTRREVGYVVSDMELGIPIRDSCVSCVTCIATFEYARDPFFLLDEISRILVPDGYLVIQVINLVWLPRRIRLLAGRFPSTGASTLMQDRVWNGGYLHQFTLHEISSLLNECGFRELRKGNSGRFRRTGELWPSLMSPDILILARKES
jgi:ubiquinone/menaquinone biosynthesis C-methylase UbiE